MVVGDAGSPVNGGDNDAAAEDVAVTIERVRAPGYLDDLTEQPLAWVRSQRASVTDLETRLSYVRRLVQGRLDIVVAEQRRRRDGAPHDLASLVDQLPDILAEGAHATGPGRLVSVMEPGPLDPVLVEQMAVAAPESVLSNVTETGDDELARTAVRLSELESDMSQQRHSCHEALDRLDAEVVERYRNGEATVDNLLS